MYDVVIAGFRLNAGETPAKILERALGVDPTTAKVLTRQFPALIVANASQEHAQRLFAYLTAAGARVELRPHQPVPVGVAPREVAPTLLDPGGAASQHAVARGDARSAPAGAPSAAPGRQTHNYLDPVPSHAVQGSPSQPAPYTHRATPPNAPPAPAPSSFGFGPPQTGTHPQLSQGAVQALPSQPAAGFAAHASQPAQPYAQRSQPAQPYAPPSQPAHHPAPYAAQPAPGFAQHPSQPVHPYGQPSQPAQPYVHSQPAPGVAQPASHAAQPFSAGPFAGSSAAPYVVPPGAFAGLAPQQPNPALMAPAAVSPAAAQPVSGQAESTWTPEVTGTRQAPQAAAAQRTSVYELGDIETPTPSTPAPLALEEVVPARSKTFPSDHPSQPSPKPSEARANAPAKKADASQDAAFAGLQTFGDGLEEFEEKGPALEIDESARNGPMRVAVPERKRKFPKKPVEAAFSLWEFLQGPFGSFLSLVLIGVFSLLAVGYALDPEHVLAGVGLDSMAPVLGELMGETPPQEGVQPAPSEAAAGPDGQLASSAEPAPSLHPILKMMPEGARSSMASVLRMRVPGVHNVMVEWPSEGAAGITCMLVEHKDGAYPQARVDALARTGKPVRIPDPVLTQLRDHMEAMRVARNEPKLKFTPLCLAM